MVGIDVLEVGEGGGCVGGVGYGVWKWLFWR